MAKDPTPQQWAATVLQGLGIPQSPGALQALVGWERAEGGHWNNSARYNPLNTTQREPGSKTFRSVGQGAADIGIYNSWDQGVDATIKTLQNGRYGNILKALKAGDPRSVASAIDTSPWGTHGSGLYNAITGAPKPSGTVQPFGGSVSPQAARAAAAPAGLTGGVSNPGQSADASALISLLGQRPQQPAIAGPANLPTPAAVAGPVLPQAYRALSSGQAPAPKADISSLLSLVQTPGQGPASTGAVSDAGAVSAPASPSGGSKAGPGGFKGSGVLELIHNDGGAGYGIKNGQIVNGGQVFSSVWAGHANHVHVAAGPKTTVELGKLAQSMGLHVSENPHFGGVTQGAHVADSYHYKGEAIDVSGPAAKMNAYARAVEQYNRTHRL